MLKDVFYPQTNDVKPVSYINVTVQTNMTSDYPDLNVSFQVTMIKYLLPILSVFIPHVTTTFDCILFIQLQKDCSTEYISGFTN